MAETYTLTVAGLTRELPICPINDELSIAAFILFGDVEMTVTCATELLKRAPEFDIILTAEAKSIPLAYEMSRQSGKNYIIARKGVKLYMRDSIAVEVKTITTASVQKLWLGQDDIAAMKGRRVLVVDDVVSTGGAMEAMEKLVAIGGGIVAAKQAVLAEGDSANRDDITYLAPLPLVT